MNFAQPMATDGPLNAVNAPSAPLYPQMYSLSPPQLQTAHTMKTLPALQPGYETYGPRAPSAAYQPELPETGRSETPKFIFVNAPAANIPLGHEAQQVTCPNCNVKTLTNLKYRPTFRTHVMATLLCVTGLCCLAPLPYCMKTCRSLDHYCSNCDEFIGNVRNG